MAKKAREISERSMDPAAQAILIRADALGIGTAFTRFENMAPCTVGNGKSGMCCKNCFMGPCRITKDGQVGVCGATWRPSPPATWPAPSPRARPPTRTTAATWPSRWRPWPWARRRATRSATSGKLWDVAQRVGVPTEGRPVNDVALDVARKALGEFGQQRGELAYLKHAPKKRYELWKKLDLAPRGIDREVVDVLHRTHMGDDQDPAHILKGAIRTALSRRLGRQHVGDRHQRHPVRHPQPQGQPGQPGRAQDRRGQHPGAWPRADPERDDRGRRAGPGADRLRQEQGRQGHLPWPASAAPPTRS